MFWSYDDDDCYYYYYYSRSTASPPAPPPPYSISSTAELLVLLFLFIIIYYYFVLSTSPYYYHSLEYGPLTCLGPLFNSSAELRNFVFGFLPYQMPYLSSTGLSRVLVLLGLRPASPPAPIQ